MLVGMASAHPFESLQPHVEGDLFVDLPRRVLYASSASSNSVLPQAVLRPRHAQDVAAAISFCAERGIPVTARGAGTGMSGANQGRGLVVDFLRFMRKTTFVDAAHGVVRLQPGVIYGDLQRQLAPHNLFFPPDPSSGAYCTIGGMVANNAAGAHTVKYGATREFVRAIEGVDATGLKKSFSSISVSTEQAENLHASLAGLLHKYRAQIDSGYPQVSKNASGYLLQGVLEGDSLDLAKLLCGSEGTLALFTEIELRVLALPPRRALLLASFASLEAAGEAVLTARRLRPSALEILDRSLIRAILATRLSFAAGLTHDDEAALLIECEGESDEEVRRALHEAREALRPLAGNLVEGWQPQEQRALWDLRKGAAVKARREDWKKPIRVIEDAAVPVDRVPEYIRGARAILAKHGAEAILVGHAGNGNIHVEPLLDVRDPGLRETIAALAEEVATLVKNLGGTLSGEHGDGIVRSAYLPKIYPQLMPVFAQVKAAFDPQGILNPGVILEGTNPRSLLGELRYGFEPQKTGTPFDDLVFEIERCFSCGVCRNYCPGYADSGAEETLPRAKAGLLRGLIAGLLSPAELFGSTSARQAFETCSDCNRCLVECPAGFDAGKLAAIARAQFSTVR